MSSVRVKICGITCAEDAAAAVEAGADALGFIFFPGSPRYVSPETVTEIVAGLPPMVTTVGVFVNETPDAVRSRMRETGLRCAQLHGDESPDECAAVAGSVIRAVRVGEGFEAASLEPYAGLGVTTFLLDTEKEGLYGGTGETFDWDQAVPAKSVGRVIVSGGLGPGNVAECIRTVRPYAVDTGSGVEAQPGKKDHDKVRAFIEAARII